MIGLGSTSDATATTPWRTTVRPAICRAERGHRSENPSTVGGVASTEMPSPLAQVLVESMRHLRSQISAFSPPGEKRHRTQCSSNSARKEAHPWQCAHPHGTILVGKHIHPPTPGRHPMKKLYLAVAVSLCGLVSPARAQEKSVPPKQSNILFIAIDDLNDWVGCLGGHPQARTPNIDRLAKKSLLFTRAYCA